MEAARKAAVVGLEVNKAEAAAVPRAREAAARAIVDAVMVGARAVPRMTTKVVFVAVAEVGVATAGAAAGERLRGAMRAFTRRSGSTSLVELSLPKGIGKHFQL